jgi:FkbM family methyltransferase
MSTSGSAAEKLRSMKADPVALDVLAAVVRAVPRGRGYIARIAGRVLRDYFRNCYITTRYGAKLAIAPSSLDFFVTVKHWGGSWEHWVYDTCRWVMPTRGVFYDIGANVGYMSVELLHEFPQITCVAFEPQNHLADVLAKSAALNDFQPRMRIIECALSNRGGTGALNQFSHDIHASLSEKEKFEKRRRQVTVNVMRLDEAVERYSLQAPDLIKIDIEGHEAAALSGGLRTLRKSKPNIVFECSSIEKLHDILDVLSLVGDYQLFHAVGSYRPLLRFETGKSISDKVDVLAVESTRLPCLPSVFAEHHTDNP